MHIFQYVLGTNIGEIIVTFGCSIEYDIPSVITHNTEPMQQINNIWALSQRKPKKRFDFQFVMGVSDK